MFNLTNCSFGTGNGEYYTIRKNEIYASSGLNRISENSKLSKFPIKIEVNNENKKIVNVSGLDEVFIHIHTGEIEKALGALNAPAETSKNRNRTYVEDWKLRKQIINFLNQNQTNLIEPKTIYEPRNPYRRLDKDSGVDEENITCLFSIELEDGFGIIWENIDLTEDRATHIFKANRNNHINQIEKIADIIVSHAQLRSTLITNKRDKQLQIFKNDLGYIASIRKQRGRNKSFEDWTKKLTRYLKRDIPQIPTNKEREMLHNWIPKTIHSYKLGIPKVNNPTRINNEETPFVNFQIPEEKIVSPQTKGDINFKILEALKSFNCFFKDALKPNNL